MGHWLSIPILGFAAILGSTFVPQIRVFGGQPDLVLLLVVSWAIVSPLEEAITWAFVGGIFADLLSAAPTGTSVIGMIFVAFLIDRIKNQLISVNLLILVGFTLIAVAVQWVSQSVIIAFSGYAIRPFEQFFYTLLPAAVYNVVFVIPTYLFIRRVKQGFTPRRRSRRLVSE